MSAAPSSAYAPSLYGLSKGPARGYLTHIKVGYVLDWMPGSVTKRRGVHTGRDVRPGTTAGPGLALEGGFGASNGPLQRALSAAQGSECSGERGARGILGHGLFYGAFSNDHP